jgi:hypothetical protein
MNKATGPQNNIFLVTGSKQISSTRLDLNCNSGLYLRVYASKCQVITIIMMLLGNHLQVFLEDKIFGGIIFHQLPSCVASYRDYVGHISICNKLY